MNTATKTFVSGYVSEETDRKLTDFADRLLRMARKLGGHDGRRQRPLIDATDLTPHTGQLTTAVERECMAHLGNMKYEVHKTSYERFEKESAEKIKTNKSRILDLKHENEIDGAELNASPAPKRQKQNVFPYLVAAFAVLGEGYFNALAFENLGGGVIGDYVLGLLVAVIEGAISLEIGKQIGKQADGKKRYTAIIALALVNLGIVFGMSVLRANVIAGETDIAIPAWVFFLINLALVVGAVALSQRLFPVKEADEERRVKQHQRSVLEAKIAERTAEIEKLEAENISLEKAAAEKLEQYLVIRGQAQYICKYLDSSHQQAIAAYKTENIRGRGNGTPECFRMRVLSLNLFEKFNS